MSAVCCARRAHEAGAKHRKGEIDAAALKEVRGPRDREVIRQQEPIGLQSITDGEFRRDLVAHRLHRTASTASIIPARQDGTSSRASESSRRELQLSGKVALGAHPMLDHFKFLKANVKAGTPKMTMPRPPCCTCASTRGGGAGLSGPSTRSSTPAKAYRRRCATSTRPAAATCSSTIRVGHLAAGRVPRCRRISASSATIPEGHRDICATDEPGASQAKPADMTVMHPHLPRQLPAAPGSRAEATTTWPRTRSPGCDCRRLLPRVRQRARRRLRAAALHARKEKARGARPGRAPSSPQLESKDDLKRRIDEAAKFVPRENSASARNAASPDRRRQQAGRGRAGGRSSSCASTPRAKSGDRSEARCRRPRRRPAPA